MKINHLTSDISEKRKDCLRGGVSVFVGGGTLAIRCAQLALQAGCEICAVLSTDDVFSNWTLREGIPRLSSIDGLMELIGQRDVDLLFSIANPLLLPIDLVRKLRRGAYNYHDGPLPRYAGVHATSWALLAHEREFAISWHLVEEGIDTGDLVVQKEVSIETSDTALTLNLRCYESAIVGFMELLSILKMGKRGGIRQKSEGRSYFPRWRRPDAAGCLRWDRPARDISAMARALSFGAYHANPLGSAKILTADGFLTVESARVLNQCSELQSGSLIEIDRDFWRISTNGGHGCIFRRCSWKARERHRYCQALPS